MTSYSTDPVYLDHAATTPMRPEAIAAMATSRGWPVLHEMEKQGGYPDVLYEFAAAIPSGPSSVEAR